MYSVVVMMALSGSGEAPDLGGRNCNGCNGCYSSCASSCNGCRGGLFGRRRDRGCHGCNGGCNGCYTTTHCCSSGAVKEMKKDDGKKPDGTKPKDPPKPKEEGRVNSAPATIVVNLPADAKLTVDSYVTTSTSARRVFTSPALSADQDFTYTFKADLTRDGKTETVTKVVSVRGGETTNVDITFPSSVAAK